VNFVGPMTTSFLSGASTFLYVMHIFLYVLNLSKKKKISLCFEDMLHRINALI
jgi:hypothetical protein